MERKNNNHIGHKRLDLGTNGGRRKDAVNRSVHLLFSHLVESDMILV